MTVPFYDPNRAVIPRWRSFDATRREEDYEEVSPRPLTQDQESDLQRIFDDWNNNKSLPFAADALSGAIASGNPQRALEPAHFILRLRRIVPPAVLSLATSVIEDKTVWAEDALVDEFDIDTIQSAIVMVRECVREYASDPIPWVELSRLYTIAGSDEKADRAMIVALGLAPRTRYVLRSAARLAIHLGEPDRAAHILAPALGSEPDPWLLAAEIASSTARGRTSKHVTRASRWIEKNHWSKRAQSELTSAVATVEMENGRHKAAKRLFVESLKSPTENAIAQVAWAVRQDSSLESIVRNPVALDASPEARAWRHYLSGEFKSALSDSEEWLRDQPFSSRPAIHGSFIAIVGLDDMKGAVRIAELGLRANRGEFLLVNNYAVAKARSGDAEKALIALRAIKPSRLTRDQRIAWLATRGLVEFRRGNAVEGRQLYDDALALASGPDHGRLHVLASLFYANEELENGGGRIRADPIISLIAKRRAKLNDKAIDVFAKRVEAKLARSVAGEG